MRFVPELLLPRTTFPHSESSDSARHGNFFQPPRDYYIRVLSIFPRCISSLLVAFHRLPISPSSTLPPTLPSSSTPSSLISCLHAIRLLLAALERPNLVPFFCKPWIHWVLPKHPPHYFNIQEFIHLLLRLCPR